MKTKILFFYSIFLSVLFLVISCEKNELDKNDVLTNLSPEDAKIASAMERVAKKICYTTNDHSLVKEIHNMVNASIYYGLDEDVNFEDLFNVGESKIITLPQSTKISKALFNSNKTNSLDDDIQLLLESGTRLYWPYSDNWDGVKQPVITFAAVDSREEKLLAYKLRNINGIYYIDSLIVDEIYAINNPVWVITKSEIDYQALPDFKKGEVSKNNLYFVTRSKSAPKVINHNPPLNDTNYVYNLILGRVQCTAHFDSWFFGGGSELRFTMVGSKMIGTQISADFATPIIEANFRRREINQGTWKNINTLINFDFTPNEVYNGFAIWEEDGGVISQIVLLPIQYNQNIMQAEFRIKERDDLIYRIAVERSAFFSTNTTDIGNGLHGGFTIYGAGGDVRFTLPWQIFPRAY